jgi:hypothetical protein
MNKIQILTIVTFGILLSAFKCQTDNPKPCSVDIACTMEFRTISIQVVDEVGNPILLDSYEVLDSKTGEDITPANDLLLADPHDGFYVLFDDSKADKYKGKKINVTFKGYKESKLIAQGTFDVGADCCHVYPITKNLKIIVNP